MTQRYRTTHEPLRLNYAIGGSHLLMWVDYNERRDGIDPLVRAHVRAWLDGMTESVAAFCVTSRWIWVEYRAGYGNHPIADPDHPAVSVRRQFILAHRADGVRRTEEDYPLVPDLAPAPEILVATATVDDSRVAVAIPWQLALQADDMVRFRRWFSSRLTQPAYADGVLTFGRSRAIFDEAWPLAVDAAMSLVCEMAGARHPDSGRLLAVRVVWDI